MARSIKRNILISSAGRRVELVEIWKKEVKKYLGNDVLVYANDINPSLSAACNMADYSFQICEVSNDNYIENLIRECISKNIGIVIPTIDTELEKLSKYRNEFQKEGINIIISDLDIVKRCRNKKITSRFFKTLGIDSPEIYNKNNLKFPLFLKPYNGSSSVGLKIIKNDSQLSKDDINNPESDLITPNEREARFALGDQDSGIRPLASSLYDQAECKLLILKIGDRGVLTCRSKNHESPDSFFVVDSLEKKMEIPPAEFIKLLKEETPGQRAVYQNDIDDIKKLYIRKNHKAVQAQKISEAKQKTAIISDATVMSNPLCRGMPLPVPPRPHVISLKDLSFISTTLFQVILLGSIFS